MILPVHARVVVIQLRRIQAEQNVYFFARPCLRLVDLVVLREGMWKMTNRREFRIFIDDWRVEPRPGMLIKPASDHLPVFRPLVVRIQCCVDADEPFPIFLDERHHVFLLPVIQVEFARRARENDRVEVVEVLRVLRQLFFGNQFGIGAQDGFPQPSLASHVVDRRHGVGD